MSDSDKVVHLQDEQDQILHKFIETHDPKLIRQAMEIQIKIETLLAFIFG